MDARRQLDEIGYVVLPGFMETGMLAELRERVETLYQGEGERAGAEFKQEPGSRRLANLVDKGDVFLTLLARPEILKLVRHVLGPEVKLSSMNARSVNPQWRASQPLHADMGAVADERGYWVSNTVWLLDDFTPDNGALRAIAGSHRWGRLPQDVLDDPLAPHGDETLLTGKAGDVLVMNAHLWHGGTANRTDRPRRAVHVFYCRRDKPQQQYQKQLVSAAVQAKLTAEQRELLALDDPANDALSAEVATRSGFLK
jgi:ectoine hydroxylase-related dioxygenase (phytanoyl-CoA dioxygenase family)